MKDEWEVYTSMMLIREAEWIENGDMNEPGMS